MRSLIKTELAIYITCKICIDHWEMCDTIGQYAHDQKTNNVEQNANKNNVYYKVRHNDKIIGFIMQLLNIRDSYKHRYCRDAAHNNYPMMPINCYYLKCSKSFDQIIIQFHSKLSDH